MTTFIEVLEAIGTFLAAMAGRSALFLAGALALTVPALILAIGWRALERRRGANIVEAGGTTLLRGAYYAPNHTWLAPRREGDLVVGLDDLAQRLLPSATCVDLPRAGMHVHKGDPIAVVHAGALAARVTAPVDGIVVSVNRRVRGDPSLVKREPYGAGWLFRIAPEDGGYASLPRNDEADGWLRKERSRLSRLVEAELGLAAADGGELVAPAPALLGEDGWRKVVASFLRSA
jgi:glycine cleavage system H lipoate-binding protein